MRLGFEKIVTDEILWIGRIDAETLQRAVLKVVCDEVDLSPYASGLTLKWSVTIDPDAPELTFSLVKNNRWVADEIERPSPA